ncbi:carbohydrate ABC transporter permease [Paenibacillus sp. LHD-117]|uniref:carbohydrate ABC transporter permease n=1 Tax=Paenibacillus sp. LHD-117 TaxID=3071412 RepID=UPI0027E01AEB|nr:carbohydrate ABC transporter permease [Paenibacillus sp. LHD-117]MDQ6419646.1 carbohydrate ABC transporter permease [Paenibacillus sp. LHD-117]
MSTLAGSAGAKLKPRSNAAKAKAAAYATYAILIAWSCTTILPLLWVLLNSFKTSDEILTDAFGFPEAFRFGNYINLNEYGNINMLKGFANSLIISGSVVLGVALVGGLASFVLARFQFAGKSIFHVLFVVCMLLPQFAVIIPNFILIQELHLNGTYLSVILPQIAGNLSFAIIMMTGFMASLPAELEEAAVMDGASIWKIYYRILLPLCLPIFATVSIMIFLWSYNELLIPLVYLPIRDMQPISVLLSLVSNAYGTDYGAMMAAITISIVPLLVLYMLSQETVIKGLTAGAVKG